MGMVSLLESGLRGSTDICPTWSGSQKPPPEPDNLSKSPNTSWFSSNTRILCGVLCSELHVSCSGNNFCQISPSLGLPLLYSWQQPENQGEFGQSTNPPTGNNSQRTNMLPNTTGKTDASQGQKRGQKWVGLSCWGLPSYWSSCIQSCWKATSQRLGATQNCQTTSRPHPATVTKPMLTFLQRNSLTQQLPEFGAEHQPPWNISYCC